MSQSLTTTTYLYVVDGFKCISLTNHYFPNLYKILHLKSSGSFDDLCLYVIFSAIVVMSESAYYSFLGYCYLRTCKVGNQLVLTDTVSLPQ